jgi:hypothetical protein
MMTSAATNTADAPSTPLVRSSEVAGLRMAINRCGGWPDAGTLFELSEAVYLAEREVDRIENIAARYSRRFGPPGAGINAAPTRLWARYHTHTIRDIYDWRAESFRKLVRDPVAGCA